MSKNESNKTNSMENHTDEKGKVKNQNQTHNSRREGMGPNTKRRAD